METEISRENLRSRSSRRLRHEAEMRVFETRQGSLEQIRQQLGLRPSQICEILKVHPSAWIRWTKTHKAPPHVYQMLEWYIELLRWRGQYKGESSFTQIAKEDPKVHVPAENEEVSGRRSEWVNKRTLYLMLSVSWGVQLVLIATLIYFLKYA